MKAKAYNIGRKREINERSKTMFVLKANGKPTEIFEDFYKALVEKTAREEKEKETIGYFATYYTIEKVK